MALEPQAAGVTRLQRLLAEVLTARRLADDTDSLIPLREGREPLAWGGVHCTARNPDPHGMYLYLTQWRPALVQCGRV